MDLRHYFTAKPKTKADAPKVDETPKKSEKKTSTRKKTIIPDLDDEDEEVVVQVNSKHFTDAKPAAPPPKKQIVEVDPKAFFASAKANKTRKGATPAVAEQAVPTKPVKESNLKDSKEPKAEKEIKESKATTAAPASPAPKRAKRTSNDDYFEDDSDAESLPLPKPKVAQTAKVEEKQSKTAPPTSPKKTAVKSSSSTAKKRKSAYEDEEGEDDEAYQEEKEEKAKPTKKMKATNQKTVDSNAMDVDVDVDMDMHEIKEEKPKKFNFWAHKNKAGPSALGSKEIPKGQDNCLAGFTFVFTGELSSITREDAADLVKRYSGRVTGSPSGKTSFVIVGDDAGQSKLDKVKKLKIKTLNEDEFFDLIRTSPAKTEDGEILKTPSKGSSSVASASNTEDAPKRTIKSAKSEASTAASSLPAVTSSSSASTADANTTSSSKPAAKTKGKPTQDRPQDSELWTTKYRPRDVKDLCGNNAAIQRLSRWLQGWEESYANNFKKDNADKTGTFRAVLISGPPGIGKTSAAHLVGNTLGYNIVEFNASDTRSKKSLDEEVRDLLDNQSLAGYFQHGTETSDKGKSVSEDIDPSMAKKQLIIMDEVDGMAGGDRGGIAQLISFIKKTRVPIICICNDRQSPKVRSLVNSCFDMRFQRPQVNQVRSRLMSILHKEGCKVPGNVLDKLVSGSQSDIRQVLNMLSTWSLTQQEMDYDEGTALSKASEKYVALNPFQIAEQLLVETNYRALSLPDKFDTYFNDYQLAPLMIQENYVRMNPTEARGDMDGLAAIELMSKAADSLSDADLVDTLIHGSAQHWSLMPTHAAFSCVRPSFFVHGSMRPGSGGNFGPMMQFPSYLGQYSKSSKYNRIVKDLQIRMRLKISGDKNEVRQSYLPALFPAITRPLVKDGVDAIPELIELMDSYYLSKEDWEAVLELGIGRNDGKKVMDSIPSAVKSAFTRKYNAESHPQPFLKAAAVSKGRGSSGGVVTDEVPDNLDVVEADAPVPEEVDETTVAEEESIEKDSNIKQKKTKGGADAGSSSKAKGKGKAKGKARK